MNKAFEKIALLEGVIAAAFVTDDGKLAGWCANSVIAPDNLFYIAQTCRSVLSASRAEQRPAETGAVAFGQRTVVFREASNGIFMVYLDSPVNDAVLAWLFGKVSPLLAEEGIKLD